MDFKFHTVGVSPVVNPRHLEVVEAVVARALAITHLHLKTWGKRRVTNCHLLSQARVNSHVLNEAENQALKVAVQEPVVFSRDATFSNKSATHFGHTHIPLIA